MFNFHVLPNEKRNREWTSQILYSLFPDLVGSPSMKKLLAVCNALVEANVSRGTTSGSSEGDIPTLSLRQLIRLARRLQYFPDDLSMQHFRSLLIFLDRQIETSLLYPFLSIAVKQAVDQALAPVEVSLKEKQETPEEKNIITRVLDDGHHEVEIGRVRVIRRVPRVPALVPKTLFYPVPKHVERLEDMAKDFTLGQHLLLIGNQGRDNTNLHVTNKNLGVGKNVLTDHLLHLLGYEREYTQLHRDSSVQALTSSPSLEEGKVVWKVFFFFTCISLVKNQKTDNQGLSVVISSEGRSRSGCGRSRQGAR